MKRKNNGSGFTLVELLVVISIIALLLAVLIPALSRARDLGQRIVCLSNMRSCITAWSAYSAANNGLLVGGIVGVKGTTTDPTLTQYWYSWVEIPQDAAGNYTGGTPDASFTYQDASMEDEIRGIKNGLLYNYTKDEKVYHCASDPRASTGEAWRSFTIVAGMNTDYPSYNRGNFVKNAKKINEIKTPSNKYVFVENRDSRGWNMGFWDIAANSRAKTQWWNVVAGWHKKCSDWGMADGHVETQQWRDKRTIQICTETDYAKQVGLRASCSVNNSDLFWIVDRRMNSWQR